MRKGQVVMSSKAFVEYSLLEEMISDKLKPYVSRIDEEAFYAKDYLQALGQARFFEAEATEEESLVKRFALIEETAKTCMTTAFCIWCHLAAITYLSFTENIFLKKEVLPDLITGKLLSGTGLSNPLKSFAHLEKLHLKAEEVAGGYLISGSLPAVSNIGPHQAFAFVADQGKEEKIMGFVYCDTLGITLRERVGFIGVNGSATYSVTFDEVFIPEEQMISREVDDFIKKIRGYFLAYQIPLAFGLITASIEMMEKLEQKHQQNNINRFLPIQSDQLRKKYNQLRLQLSKAISQDVLDWNELTNLRLKSVYVTLEAVQAAMLHHGGGAYVKPSVTERRLREAYFLVNLTPTVKHLEALRHQ